LVPGRSDAPYRLALLDWLACACAGADERAAVAVRATGEDLVARVAFAATAGHVLDFDDTVSDGVAHVSAACAPAALVVAASLGASAGAALDAYAAGFEAMASVVAASHPGLYEAGWHPTAVCAPVGAAVAAAQLLALDAATRDRAVGLALLRAGGTRGAFGSDAKAIQVGMAAAAGVQGVLMARAGAIIDVGATVGPLGFAGVLPVRWPDGGLATGPPSTRRGIDTNWIKLLPSCLGTHAPIEAAQRARAAGHTLDGHTVAVRVHPVARQAAHIDAAQTGLQAKFSIPYCVAHTLTHGPPGVRDFAAVDPVLAQLAAQVTVTTDVGLAEFAAALSVDGVEVARVPGPRGSPEYPATPAELDAKLTELTGSRLRGALDDLHTPAAALLVAAGLAGVPTAVRRSRAATRGRSSRAPRYRS
jgi:2-methylcitrate dehydratase PrpD